jgi:hypothetical protein
MKTIKLAPTWPAAVRIYCAVLKEPKAAESAKQEAEADLLKLAHAYEKLVATAEFNETVKEQRELGGLGE